MHIHQSNVDHEAPADRNPGPSYPFEIEVPVNQDVEMRITVLLEFKDADVLRCTSILSLQVNAQFRECLIQVADGVAFDFGGIER